MSETFGSAALAAGLPLQGWSAPATSSSRNFPEMRPKPADRKFTSGAVEAFLVETSRRIPDADLATLFRNCYPNTLDTTVEFTMLDGKPDTFVLTGDIAAMWLRDSSAQVWPHPAACCAGPAPA